jgi:IclR family transcriptional regulator, pca regulon regulatory protein
MLPGVFRFSAQRPAACCFPAWSDRKFADIIGDKRYPGRTPKTLTGAAAIIREICMAAKKGYALSAEELELGMRSLAVPVHGADGSVIAAMSVSAFAPRISVDDLIGRCLGVLKESAAALEHSVKTC